jgi:hypothetical protein
MQHLAHQKFYPTLVEKAILGEELKIDHIEADEAFVADLYRYSRYFVGAYGAGMHMIMKPWECCFLCSCDGQQDHIEGSDFLGMSKNAFLRRANCHHTNLLYANFVVDFA